MGRWRLAALSAWISFTLTVAQVIRSCVDRSRGVEVPLDERKSTIPRLSFILAVLVYVWRDSFHVISRARHTSRVVCRSLSFARFSYNVAQLNMANMRTLNLVGRAAPAFFTRQRMWLQNNTRPGGDSGRICNQCAIKSGSRRSPRPAEIFPRCPGAVQ
jgi:hypothetical protein